MPTSTSRRTRGWWRRRTSAQRRRLLIAAAVLAIIVVVVVSCSANAAHRARIGNPVDFGNLPESIGEWEGEQIEIAAIIIREAQERDIPTRGQQIAVMVAMGESSLTNLDHGDDAHNPDGSLNCSLGVFQQQWCIGWGTRDEVLDPAFAAGAFLDEMVEVDGWQTMAPSEVGHAVQVNADPNHYARYFDDASEVVSQLTGVAAVP